MPPSSHRKGLKPGRRRIRYRQTKLGQCFILSCKRPAILDTIRCRYHLDKVVASNAKWRKLRQQLGFCKRCRAKKVPGYNQCRKHLAEAKRLHQEHRDRKAQARGWKMVKVKA